MEAESRRRAEASASESVENARAALDDYARSVTDEVKGAAETITTMLKELRARGQACRDADFQLHRAIGVAPQASVRNFYDPYSEEYALESVEPGLAEVVRVLERFVAGDLNAQRTQRFAAEAQARQKAIQAVEVVA